MSETRKLAAILAADVAGFSRLTATDEERTVARLRGLRTDLIDPAISVHHGHVVKRTGDGILIEFRSVVDAVRCSIEVQNGMVERNAGLPPERQILLRVGIHLGDVIEEEDGDLMGDGVNIAARLEGICEPGGVCLSNAAYEQVRDKVTADFTELGERELKNIARPVRAYAIAPPSDHDRVVASPGREQAVTPKNEPPRLSIVVLPFANIGGDPEQEYFVDGVTESLTTDLSRISGSFVIARNTAFTYKGKPVDVKQIGRELNVRYVLEGSVQRGANRVRVNVQLIDAETGNHLWAERFDKPLADLFDMQDEIVARLANQLMAELIAAEARRTEHVPHPNSMDLYFQGLACVNRGLTYTNLAQGLSHFERALALDPKNVDALVGVGQVNSALASGGLTDDPEQRFIVAENALSKALSAAPNHPWAHFWFADVLTFTNRAVQGIAECERSLVLDRNLASAHQLIGIAKFFIGRAEETEVHVQQALRLSPRDTRAFIWFAIVAFSQLLLGRYETAVEWGRRSIEMNRNWPLVHFFLAAALVRLNRLSEAKAMVASGLALDPNFSLRRYHQFRSMSDNGTFLAQFEQVGSALQQAGVPQG
jgi:TolB-like protein/class 3 adenylate cyclase